MTVPPTVQALIDAGVSIWLDDLSRDRLRTGNLQDLIDTSGVSGVTTNPSIFQAALGEGHAYDEQIATLAAEGTETEGAVFALTTDDVRTACDVLRPVHERTGGVDGRVSIEVDPRLAHDTAATIDQVRRLAAAVDRPNLLIKIPATVEGLPAITAVLAEGISVNVTLIFGLERYRAVMNAFMAGLEQAQAAGRDLGGLMSVASFFVSRMDVEVDRRLDEIGTEQAAALRGKAGIANARLAYAAYEEAFSTPRWAELAAAGAHRQRPLWASTGVKDPAYPDTLYVDSLVAPDCVNTMPERTLDALIDHGEITGDTIHGTQAESEAVLDALAGLGIDYAEVTALLEAEGVEKFEKSWEKLLDQVTAELGRAAR